MGTECMVVESASSAGAADATKKRQIRLSEVALHSTDEDFWTGLHGSVYDMSGFAKDHPGGSMVLLAAGTDCTVMFEQYHVLSNGKRLTASLQNREIGVIHPDDGPSPAMGSMYPVLKERVRERLKGEPARPKNALYLFLLDVLFMCVLVLWSWKVALENSYTSIWSSTCASQHTGNMCEMLLLAHLGPPILLRLFGQSHAVGHLYVSGADYAGLWRRILLLIAAPGAGLATHPHAMENPRKLLNEARECSQNEFPQRRGPSEHQAVHHVRGAELEHDECLNVSSLFGFTRISEWQPHRWYHHLQLYRLHEYVFAVLADVGLVAGVALAERVSLLYYYVIHQALVWDIPPAIVGMINSLVIAKAHLILLMGCRGWIGVALFLLAYVLKHRVFNSHVQLFFAQHMWNVLRTEREGNTDWARHNAETSNSLRGMEYHPVAWLNAGASPSTITYHLEHTLLPGVNYLHLPKIAAIVDETCAEFNVHANVVTGGDDLRKFYRAALQKLAVAGKAEKAA
eukprot:TRINITY_DN2557_c1_g1_i2.p1 TRINITY_DN2557_c1_g1~~TRINITY_DN2557_c1_g1_i2.p1  ORF type:complete len:514 (+),score=65.74 TRINITY_DN2557_c1_g1_i2:68-1609(+)